MSRWSPEPAKKESTKGMEKGMLAGKIQTLQELLGERASTDAEQMAADATELSARNTALQQRLRDRQA